MFKPATTARLYEINAGVKVDGFFYVRGTWFKVTGKTSLRFTRVKPLDAETLTRKYAANVADYHASILGATKPATVFASGKSPRPELSVRNFGGNTARYAETLRRMGKIA